MKVLVIGSGGREHAIAWRLAQSPSVERVFVTPGNPGISRVATCVPLTSPSPDDLLQIARSCQADLTVVGPESPLVAGVVDAFQAARMPIIGPTAAQARLEGSKIYAKQFFAQHKIPTASFTTAGTRPEARAALGRYRFPVVLKLDGLAAGKGVIIAHDPAEAEQALITLGPPLVIEEFLQGDEVSFIVLSDGKTILPLEPCQDHKAAFDGDQGPNTGGMGAYCDSRILTPHEREQILDRIIRPTIEATDFTGFLYAGLMMTADGPKLLEYNVRLGDPETQPIMHRMVADFGQVLWSAAHGRLEPHSLSWSPDPSVAVVLAASGYPSSPRLGDSITGIDEAESLGATVFHAGTRVGPSGLETSGGRVLTVTQSGPTLQTALASVYSAVSHINFAGMHYRRDIGRKGLARYNKGSLAQFPTGT